MASYNAGFYLFCIVFKIKVASKIITTGLGEILIITHASPELYKQGNKHPVILHTMKSAG